MRRPTPLLLALVLSLTLASAEDDSTKLLRFPDIHEDRIAFVHAGDLWIADSSGGVARRLTSHVGLELFPKFSPDGRWIAFSGEYGGNRQVFVISVDGGTPRQLTWYNDVGPMPPRGGYDYRIIGWTPDGKNIVFRGNRLPWGVRMGRFYQVPVDGGLETPLAMPEAGGGDISPNGRKIAYTPMDREFRTWKRYRGGRAQDVWIYDLAKNKVEKITDFDGTDNQPVWLDRTIYFSSDRDRTLNLFAYDTKSGKTTKVTDHGEYDVLWPSGGPGGVVYENGGSIWRYDPQSKKSAMVPIRVYGDFAGTVPYLQEVSSFIGSGDLSPSGVRAVFDARGDIYTVPAEHGQIRNLTRSQGVREMEPIWSPDGRWIAYLSDRSGEYEIYVRPQDGSGEERRVTTDGNIWRFPPIWSPDGKKIAFGDKHQTLSYVDVESGTVTKVDRSTLNDITMYRWSPDSRWIAYVKTNDGQMATIWAHDLESSESHQLTDDWTNNFAPTFDPNGKYLYFLSQRDFNLTFSGWEFNYLYTNPTRIYVAALTEDTPLPFVPRSDEVEPEEEESASDAEGTADEESEDEESDDGESEDEESEDEESDDGESEDEEELRVEIDVEGFPNRVISLVDSNEGYRSLTATKSGLLYMVDDRLESFDLESEESSTIIEGINGYTLSWDESKILYAAQGSFGIADNQPDQESEAGLLDLSSMEMKIDPRAEWAQLYADAWRTLRDWFYDPGLHGQDWEMLRERYGRLLPHVAHRADLDYILGELGGELNAGHVYVQPGDQPGVERLEGGLLGATLEADRSGYYRIAHIFPGENWHPDFRSPLTEPGVTVKEGDFLLAVDGVDVPTSENPYRFLEGKAERVVTLLVNDSPSREGAREEKVRPIARETNLRYLDWVQQRRRIVEEASGGRIGYIHLPDTAVQGNRELRKYFYPQAHKDALIIDDRYNGGGFIPDRMIELLSRPLLNFWVGRGTEPTPEPGYGHQGPKACLINGLAASGGDAFPYYFRKVGLGPLIGMRTWGGLIGLSGNPSLADGGAVLAPTFRFLGTDGAWEVEGIGVAPDIEVLDRADLVVQGRDPSLEKAIEVLMEELERNPPSRITVPPAPVDRP